LIIDHNDDDDDADYVDNGVLMIKIIQVMGENKDIYLICEDGNDNHEADNDINNYDNNNDIIISMLRVMTVS